MKSMPRDPETCSTHPTVTGLDYDPDLVIVEHKPNTNVFEFRLSRERALGLCFILEDHDEEVALCNTLNAALDLDRR